MIELQNICAKFGYKEVLKNIPLERIIFETDAPYLSPTPYRGQINLPKYIFNTI